MYRLSLLTLLVGCAPLRTKDAINNCEPVGLTVAHVVPLDSLTTLAGNYQFIIVGTSPGMEGEPAIANLVLKRADTLERFYERRLGNYVRAGDRPLVGQLTWRDADQKENTEHVVVRQNSTGIELVSGCSDCTDAEFVYYSVLQLTKDGFTGTWHDPQTGIGRLVDKNGKELPDPRGYFCAIRL